MPDPKTELAVAREQQDRFKDVKVRYERNGRPMDLTGDSTLETYKTNMASKLNQKIKLTCPTNDFVLDYIERNAEFGLPMAVPGSAKGGTLFICGNGRHLPDHVHMIKKRGMHDKAHVWGCNGAAVWLHQNGIKLTHGFTTDTSARMWEECWKEPPPAHYLMGTCVDTRTIEHVQAHGHRITLFHNFTGVPGEMERYTALYGTAPLVGEGLNSVNRALSLAEMLGFEKIYVLGAVSHLDPDDTTMHASGAKSKQQFRLVAQIDGRRYATHADMLYSAIDLCKKKRALGKRLVIVGDKNDLGMLLCRKSPSFWDRCIKFGES